jgi:hypothetical protein
VQSALALLLAALAGAVLARTVFPPAVASSSAEQTSTAALPSESARTLGLGLAETTEMSPVRASAPTPPAPALAPVAAASDTSIVEPRKADATTELVITSEPAGARVTVNGIGWGTTPVTIRHLTPGNKRIRVTKDGYASSERALPVAEGSRRTLNVELATLP